MWCFLFVFILTSDKTSRPLVIYLKRGLVYIWSFLIKFQPFIMMLFSLLIRTWRTKAARLKPSEEKTMWVSFNAWILQNMIVMTAPGEDEGIKSYKTELSVKVKCEYFLVNWIKQNKTFEDVVFCFGDRWSNVIFLNIIRHFGDRTTDRLGTKLTD